MTAIETEANKEVTIASESPTIDRRRISASRRVVYSGLLLFLILGTAEIAGQILMRGRSTTSRYLAATYYKKRDWGTDLLTHQGQLKIRYEPYVEWRRADYRSNYVNVIDGERTTVHPQEPAADAVTLWCFGGSTMWGEGVRDGYTIPSHLARLARQSGLEVSVRNLGESGWVSTQEALQLSLLLRRGERPDVVVFYDGVNDVFSTYQSGRVDGSPQNRETFESFFNHGFDPRRRFYKKIALYRAAQKLAMRFTDRWQPVVGRKIEAQYAATETVKNYGATVEQVRSLAAAYDFDTAFFWQPVISYQDDFQNLEREGWLNGDKDRIDGILDFYELTTSRMDVGGVVNLSRSLGPSPPEGYFIDHNHLNEEGNGVIAQVIFTHIRPLIEKIAGKHSPEAGVPAGRE